MLADRRRQLILRRLARDGTVKVTDLAGEWGISGMTIRRDLGALEDEGLLRKVYGGAVPIRTAASGRRRVGLMVPHAQQYYQSVISGAEAAARQLESTVVMATHFNDRRLEHERLEKLVALNLDAIILATTGTAGEPYGQGWSRRDDVVSDSFVESVVDRLDVPLVLVERQLPFKLPGSRDPRLEPCVVRTAHAHGARLAVDHLYQLGHRRMLAVLVGSPTVPGVRAGLVESEQRLDMEVTVFETPGPPASFDPAAVVRHCRATDTRAVLAHPDDQGRALVEAFQEQGWRIPGDAHVISYNDVTAHLGPVPLTAVSPAREELGFEALRMAVDRIDTGSPKAVHQLTVLPRLVVRKSAPASTT